LPGVPGVPSGRGPGVRGLPEPFVPGLFLLGSGAVAAAGKEPAVPGVLSVPGVS